MQIINYILSAVLVFGGVVMLERPTPFVQLVITYPHGVLIGLFIIGVFLFHATNKWGNYKLSAESKETVIRGMTGKSIEDYRQS